MNEKEGPTWKYLVLDLYHMGYVSDKHFNDAGQQGWELVQVVLTPFAETIGKAIFKRQVN